jgi:SMI1/KNR4 family protein SUKH-1
MMARRKKSGDIRALAKRLNCAVLEPGADEGAVRDVESTSGSSSPQSVLLCLRDGAGFDQLDPENHRAHSPALVALLDEIRDDYEFRGVLVPSPGDVEEGRNWWYLVFAGTPWGATGETCLAVRPGLSESEIEQAEQEYGICFPESYRHLLCVFDHVVHNAFGLHEGLSGPRDGQGGGGFARELELLRESFEARGDNAYTSAAVLDDFLPFYTDGSGNAYLFSKTKPGPVYFSDHEMCAIIAPKHMTFDSFFASLLAGDPFHLERESDDTKSSGPWEACKQNGCIAGCVLMAVALATCLIAGIVTVWQWLAQNVF